MAGTDHVLAEKAAAAIRAWIAHVEDVEDAGDSLDEFAAALREVNEVLDQPRYDMAVYRDPYTAREETR